MSSLKTLLIAATIGTLLPSTSSASEDIAWTFAACAGRYSAEREHAWLMGRTPQGNIETNQRAFVSMVHATASRESASALLAHRIEAKHAQARLIQAADFQQDERRRSFAARQAKSLLRSCEALLLGS